MTSGADERPTLAAIEGKVLRLCREGGLPDPDVVLDNKNGEFTALWFESKVAVVIEPTADVKLDPGLFSTPEEPEAGDAGTETGEPPAEFFEALEHMAWLCEQGGFPKPDHAAFDEHERLIQFTWDHDPFDPTWQIDEFIESMRAARAKQLH
jgi:hypothetical protein